MKLKVSKPHIKGSKCPICTDPEHPFSVVHHNGPPCLSCRTPLETVNIINRTALRWWCPKCFRIERMGPKEM